MRGRIILVVVLTLRLVPYKHRRSWLRGWTGTSVLMGGIKTAGVTTVECVSTPMMIQPSGFSMSMRFHAARLYPVRMAAGELAGESSLWNVNYQRWIVLLSTMEMLAPQVRQLH